MWREGDFSKKVGWHVGPNGRTTQQYNTMTTTMKAATTPIENRADRIALWITYLNIVLYALCYQLQRPVEPFLIKSLAEKAGDATHVERTYALLNSSFSAIQTVGSPLVGLLLDRVGVRKASAMVFLASAVSYAILASASNLNILFLSKVPTALQHAFLVAQATAATSTAGNAAARAAALGRMTTAYTIGATLGPALGGYLVDGMNDLYLGAKLAVLGSLISVVLSVMFLPDVKDPRKTKVFDVPGHTRSFLEELRRAVRIASHSGVWPLLVIKVVGGIAASIHSTALPLILTLDLQFEASQIGLSMSAASLSVAAFGAVCLSPLISFLGTSGVAKTGLVSRAAMAGVLAFVISTAAINESHFVLRIVIASVFHALASHALATGLTTQTTGVVQKDEQGVLLGLEHGLFSLARIIGPPLGTLLLGLGRSGSFWSVAIACAAVDVVLAGSLAITPAGLPRHSD